MVLSLNALTFTTTVGNNPTAQTINVQNTGGGTLTWTAGTPSQKWLAVTPTTGSDAAGQTTPLAFSVDVTGMTAGTYSAAVIITPSVGKPVTVNVKLKIH
jgi:BACON domain-containing protein